jgi:FtsZ-binding cell division protein ZapB
MYITVETKTNLRFMRDDLDSVKKNLEGQIKEQNESVENLKKKQTYLETTFKNAQSHINEILGRR